MTIKEYSVDRMLLSDVFRLVANRARTAQECCDILKKYDSTALRYVVMLSESDRFSFDLPEGPIPYKPNRGFPGPGGGQRMLYHIYKELVKFMIRDVDGVPIFGCSGERVPMLGRQKKTQMWIQLLEALDPTEAELLCQMKEKNVIKAHNLRRSVFERAFPELGLQDEASRIEPKNSKIKVKYVEDETGE